MTVKIQTMQAIKLPHERQKCSLGCPILDNSLNGGIPCRSLTELVGENASAKTQLCLQLLLTAQLPVKEGGLHGSSLYVYTENYFPSTRLQQLARFHSFAARRKRRRVVSKDPEVSLPKPLDECIAEPTRVFEKIVSKAIKCGFEKEGQQDRDRNASAVDNFPEKLSTADDDDDPSLTTVAGVAFDPCRNIFVESLQTPDELLTYLDRAGALLSRPLVMPVRLLVIDSIAALFRTNFDNAAGELRGRSDLFFKIASKLKKIAEDYDLAVVVTNQVTDYFEPAESARRDPVPGLSPLGSEILVTSGRRIVPALGISWAQCINTRLFLSRTSYDGNNNSIRRSMQVVFAPHLANVSRNFLVDNHGIKGVLSDECRVKEVSFDEQGVDGLSSKRKFVDCDSDIQGGSRNLVRCP